MGRKLHRKVQTRPRPHLPIIFECPHCEAEAVKIEMNENTSIATIVCSSCHITRTITDIRKMWDKVDVYGMWLDMYYEEQEAGIGVVGQEVLVEPSIENYNSPSNTSASASTSTDVTEFSTQTQVQTSSPNTDTHMLEEPEIEPISGTGTKRLENTPGRTNHSLSESSPSGFQIPKARSEVLAAKKQEQVKKQERDRKQEQFMQSSKTLPIDDYSKEYKHHSQKEEEKEDTDTEEEEEDEEDDLEYNDLDDE